MLYQSRKYLEWNNNDCWATSMHELSGKYIFFSFLKKLCAPTSARTWADCWNWRRGKMIAGCVQWALGLVPPIVLRNPYVNSTLYWKYRMKRASPPPPAEFSVILNLIVFSLLSFSCLAQALVLLFKTLTCPFFLLGKVPVLEQHTSWSFLFLRHCKRKRKTRKSNDIYFLQCTVEIAWKHNRIILRDSIILWWKCLIWRHVYLSV